MLAERTFKGADKRFTGWRERLATLFALRFHQKRH